MIQDLTSLLETSISGYEFPDKPLTALDVGCNSFLYAPMLYKFLNRHGQVKYLIGVDSDIENSPDFFSEEREKQGYRFFLGDARNLKKLLDSHGVDEEIDFITSIRPRLLGEMDEKNLEEIYLSCKEVISPNGLIVVITSFDCPRGDIVRDLLSKADFDLVVDQENPLIKDSFSFYAQVLAGKPRLE